MGAPGTIARRFQAALAAGGVAELARLMDELAADDYVQEWPQSGERIRGREAAKALNDRYSGATGTNPSGSIRRILEGDDLFVAEGTIDYGDGTSVSYVGIGEVRDGKLVRMTEYFASPFEAPEWRADLVERMEAVPA